METLQKAQRIKGLSVFTQVIAKVIGTKIQLQIFDKTSGTKSGLYLKLKGLTKTRIEMKPNFSIKSSN